MFMLSQAMRDLHSLGYDILDLGANDVRVSVDGDLRLQLQLQLHSSFKPSGLDPWPINCCCCSGVHAASGSESAGLLSVLQATDRSEVWPALSAEAYPEVFTGYGVFAGPELAASLADIYNWIRAFIASKHKSPAQLPDTRPSASNL